jgi:hypothetical protein
MDISIRYQRRDETTPRVLHLSPDEYFDPPDPGETLSVRSVPRFDDAYRYAPHRPEELWWSVVEIRDGSTFWRVRTQLLDGMRSLMHHSQESDGSEEIIHQTELGSGCWHTIRTLKLAGKNWAVVMNSLTVERAAPVIEDRNICELWSFEELKAFGDVQ